MASRRNPTPSYLLHRQSGRARAVWTDTTGKRQQRLLNGPFDSQESRTAFATLLLELEASPQRVHPQDATGLTLNEFLLAYVEYAEQHYRGPNGKSTGEAEHVKLVVRHVRELYGDRSVCEFGPLALKAVRQRFIAAGWCRKSVNQQIERVKRAFKWGASEELFPTSLYQSLLTVTGLQRGRTEAKETEPVKPVPDAVVDATLPYLNRHVRGMVELQRVTGCRPGEACIIRRADLETGGAVWLYKPVHHKNSYRGKARSIAIGPRAQTLLVGYFTPNLNEFLFSPRRAVEEIRAERSAHRKTPRFPSHLKRNAEKRKVSPTRLPDAKYTTRSYSVAVARACDRAFPVPAPLARCKGETHTEWWKRLNENQREEVKTWRRAHSWHPNQLRHSFATRVRKQHGLEAAQVLLGHSRADVTQIYAERNEELAGSVAAKIG